MIRFKLFIFLVFTVGLVLTACASSAEPGISQEIVENVESATIYISSERGTGTGFIIDPSGIAVTNNHVVTGARSYEILIGGEGEPIRAQVLGVSECSDLALIQLEEREEEYPFLKWHEGELRLGLDVYAVGFPLGDPNMTMTRGIVSKVDTSGNTFWTAVDAAIEHDAVINEGNSGGPLISPNGEVVAINYSARGQNRNAETIRYLAIAKDEALKYISRLEQGENVDSIGISGIAVAEDGLSGVFVESLTPGSVADRAGIEEGDIITEFAGFSVAIDGTMKDYCDTLRSNDPEDVLGIRVERWVNDCHFEQRDGQLNGRKLELDQTFNTCTETATPTPTAELIKPTATPTSTSGLIWEDPFDGPLTWQSGQSAPPEIKIENGHLVVQQSPPADGGYGEVIPPDNRSFPWTPGTGLFFEADIYLSSESQTSSGADGNFSYNHWIPLANKRGMYIQCNLTRAATIDCLKGIWNWNSEPGKAEEVVMITSQTAVYDTWYNIRMTIDATANVTLFINGTAVGSYQLTSAEASEVTTIRPNFSAWSATQNKLVGYADNVRVVQFQP